MTDRYSVPVFQPYNSSTSLSPYKNSYQTSSTEKFVDTERSFGRNMSSNRLSPQANENTPFLSNSAESSSVACKKVITSQLVIGLLIGTIFCGIPLGVTSALYAKEKSAGKTAAAAAASCSTDNSTTTLPSQCTSYIDITDSTRLFNSTVGCCQSDCSLTASWYRISGAAGTQISRTPTSSGGYCGASYASWFNGTYPTTVGSTVTGVICTTYANTICVTTYAVTISVTNCDSYYVFYLIPFPYCSIRYCTV